MQTFVLPKGDRTSQEARIAAFLSGLSKERSWVVDVRQRVRTRSQQQNRYLWGICYPEVLKHLPGWEAEDIHEYFLGEWSGWEVIEGMGRKRMRPIKRSSNLSTTDFMNYVDFVQRKAAEHGIYIPSPNESP